MNRRAKHHPHSRTNMSRQTQRLNATRIRENACRRCDHESFHAKLCAKRKKLVVENAFETQLRKHMQNQTQVKPALIKRRTVVVRVERPGSGIVVCHVRLLVDTFDVYRQLATQVRSKLNEPYGPGRQHQPSRPWESCDFELFAGYNFNDQALLSSLPANDDQVRFQVCCLAFCNIPVVMCRKRSAVWVDVQVRDGDKVRTVCNVRPVTRVDIIRACFPDRQPPGFDYEYYYGLTFDKLAVSPVHHGYVCDASCRVVVEKNDAVPQVVLRCMYTWHVARGFSRTR